MRRACCKVPFSKGQNAIKTWKAVRTKSNMVLPVGSKIISVGRNMRTRPTFHHERRKEDAKKAQGSYLGDTAEACCVLFGVERRLEACLCRAKNDIPPVLPDNLSSAAFLWSCIPCNKYHAFT